MILEVFTELIFPSSPVWHHDFVQQTGDPDTGRVKRKSKNIQRLNMNLNWNQIKSKYRIFRKKKPILIWICRYEEGITCRGHYELIKMSAGWEIRGAQMNSSGLPAKAFVCVVTFWAGLCEMGRDRYEAKDLLISDLIIFKAHSHGSGQEKAT